MEIRLASRSLCRLRIALQGCSGSGKTYSALLLAYGIRLDWKKIVVIDTERSADLYAHLGPFCVLSLDPPFTAERYLAALKECERSSAHIVIIDSLSHLWEGEGGILDTHAKMTGNSFNAWSKVASGYNRVIQWMLNTNMHVICCLRTKQEYVLTDKNGKQVPEKVGLKAVAKDGLDYEMTLVFDLDVHHFANCSKDRTGLFANTTPFQITSETGEQLNLWALHGYEATKRTVTVEIESCTNLQQLYALYRKFPDFQQELQLAFQARKAELMANNQPLSA